MNVYDRLIQDHAELRDLFAKLDQPDELQAFGPGKLYEDIRLKLVAHDKAEEETFYRAIDTGEPLHGLVEDGRHDHHEVQGLLEQAGGIPAGEARWLDSMREIRTKFLRHVDEEEGKMFPPSRQVLDEERADAIGRDFQDTELRLLMAERRDRPLA